jgi:hypothetical protein
MTNDRPDLSSDWAPYRDKTATFRQQPSDRKQYLVTSLRVGSISWYTDWLTVSCNVTSTTRIKEVWEQINTGRRKMIKGQIVKLLHVYKLKVVGDHGCLAIILRRGQGFIPWRGWRNASLITLSLILPGCKGLRYRRKLLEGRAPMRNILINSIKDSQRSVIAQLGSVWRRELNGVNGYISSIRWKKWIHPPQKLCYARISSCICLYIQNKKEKHYHIKLSASESKCTRQISIFRRTIYSMIQRHVIQSNSTDVSEEHVAFFFRVEE